ncbi:DUF1294 domain-containing protein [Allobacillus halotolerans]|uniref:DUF1294 domain-containing protein n=1 Tax=Allobacillus halotolerans TaxID=570278 RepID=A0ABS6GM20_9BACI|nr:DUF1294 domain-containing protein [Allobacillus halotolerans]MBU6080179.1 DUF1294 domain-containing protein [Allobacillus halotolerans]
MYLLAGWLVIINFIGFIVMGIDKRKARLRHYRIPESRIWTIALIGGALGAWAGMNVFRHKTKHIQFAFGLPLITLVWAAVFLWG